MKIHNRKKQAGMATIDVAAAVVVLVILLVVALMELPGIFFNINMSNLQQEVTTVSTAAYKAKKGRPNYRLVTMQKLCDDKYLSDKFCDGTPGQSVNAFGGDITYAPNTANPGLRDIVVTIPNDPERINEIADTLASQSRAQCVQASGCSTLAVTGNTITVTM